MCRKGTRSHLRARLQRNGVHAKAQQARGIPSRSSADINDTVSLLEYEREVGGDPSGHMLVALGERVRVGVVVAQRVLIHGMRSGYRQTRHGSNAGSGKRAVSRCSHAVAAMAWRAMPDEAL